MLLPICHVKHMELNVRACLLSEATTHSYEQCIINQAALYRKFTLWIRAINLSCPEIATLLVHYILEEAFKSCYLPLKGKTL